MPNFIKCLFGMDSTDRQPYVVFLWIDEPYYTEDVCKHPFLEVCEGTALCRYRQQIRPVLFRADFLTTQKINVVLLKCSFIILLMPFISILLKVFFSFFLNQHTSGKTALTVCGVFNQVSVLGYSVYVS